MRQSILFLCPHGAAKSVLAAAYCRQLADETGLDVEVTFAGTEPSPEVSPAVAAFLREAGLDVAAEVPRRVTQEDLLAADWVVSLGCNLDELDALNTQIERWDDIPLPSENLRGASDIIRVYVEQFALRLNQRD